MSRKNIYVRNGLLACTALVLVSPLIAEPAMAQGGRRPSLVITSDPLPESLRDNLAPPSAIPAPPSRDVYRPAQDVYSKPVRTRDISASEVTGQSYYQSTSTEVGQKVNELSGSLSALQGRVSSLAGNLAAIQQDNERKAAEYYAAVATVNTQLQTGTTPGNPRLVQRLSTAQGNLENLAGSVAELNRVAVDSAQVASEASYLLESTRAAYGLSGAVEEDHVRLAELEDSINGTIVGIERLLNNVSDDIARTSTYLSSERNNLRTLSLAVSNGDLYGKSLGNRPFSHAVSYTPGDASAGAAAPVPGVASAPAGRPLVKIRFDKSDVDYEQAVYTAVNEALSRYPDARFDLVAVHPSQGNAAEVAIESTKARRNAERVLRTLTNMGLPLDRIDLSYSESAEASSNEVHLFIR